MNTTAANQFSASVDRTDKQLPRRWGISPSDFKKNKCHSLLFKVEKKLLSINKLNNNNNQDT